MKFDVFSLNSALEAYVGPGEHQPLIGVSKLCREHGFEFAVDGTVISKLWHPKTGRKILASVTHDVPQVAFTEYDGPMAAPSSLELDASAPVV